MRSCQVAHRSSIFVALLAPITNLRAMSLNQAQVQDLTGSVRYVPVSISINSSAERIAELFMMDTPPVNSRLARLIVSEHSVHLLRRSPYILRSTRR